MRMRSATIGLLLACALGRCFAGGGEDPAANPEKEQEAGKALVAHFRDQFGISTNARYRAAVDTALTRLGAAADGRPELRWHAEVLRHDPRNPVARNASAWPGGYILTDDAFMRLIEEEAGGKAERMEALVAGVLAHEMVHVLRRDTDRLVRAYFQAAGADAGRLGSTLASSRSRASSTAEKRRKEEAADREGAFLLLRAGYRIEEMIAVFRRMAREGVGEVLFSSEMDHAKAADRVAYLLRIQAEVAEDQTRYDEAVAVVRLGKRGPWLDAAIRDLEGVCRHFPNNPSVRHALAAACHSDYLAGVPVAGQRFRPAFAFYQFEVLRDTEPARPRIERLRAAANAYQEILRRGKNTGYRWFGPTASAYALASVQLGRTDEAIRWARKGVDLSPQSWPAWNTLGNVLQARGDAAGALDAYSRALAIAGARHGLSRVLRAMYGGDGEGLESLVAERIGLMELAPVYFNLASASQDLRKTREAIGFFRLYLALDRQSEWNALAQSRLEALGASPVTVRLTGIAGVQVSAPRAVVEKAWGHPPAQGVQPDGARVLKYPGKSLAVVLDRKERVATILVQSGFRSGLGIADQAMGAPAERIEAVLGPPVSRTPAGAGVEAWDYPPYGVTLLLGAKGLEQVAIYGRPDGAMADDLTAASPGDGGDFVVAAGAPRAQVARRLGEPERVSQEGVWVYVTRGIRVRFNRDDRADLVVASRPCADAACGVRIGDPASRIEAGLGDAQTTVNLDDTVTYAFPERGIAYVVQDGQVSAIVVYLPQSS